MQDPLVTLRQTAYGWESPTRRFPNSSSFIEDLLRFTVKRAAAEVPFFRKTFAKAGIPSGSLTKFSSSLLGRLPIMTKQDLIRNYPELLAKDLQPVTSRFTSGTTGNRTCIYLSAEEIEARMLFTKLLRDTQTRRRREIQFREITVTGHGPDVPNYVSFTIPLFFHPRIPQTLDNTIVELRRMHFGDKHGRIRRVFALSPRALRFLTIELFRRKIEPSSLLVRRVLNTGNYCSSGHRKVCRDFWKADVLDTYSLAEVHGSAGECERHGAKHFSPFVFAEVLDSHTKQRVEEGQQGILTLTPLYPFQASTPLIRYWTNDFVTVARTPCRCGFRGLSITKILGRADYCFDFSREIPPTEPQRVIAVTDVIEAIESSITLIPLKAVSGIEKLGDLPPRFNMRLLLNTRKQIVIGIYLEKFKGFDAELLSEMDERLEFAYRNLSDSLERDVTFKTSIVEPKSISTPYLKT